MFKQCSAKEDGETQCLCTQIKCDPGWRILEEEFLVGGIWNENGSRYCSDLFHGARARIRDKLSDFPKYHLIPHGTRKGKIKGEWRQKSERLCSYLFPNVKIIIRIENRNQTIT